LGNIFWLDRTGVLVWFADGSKTNEDTGARMCGYDTRKRLSFSLEQCECPTVFQAEVCAVKGCAVAV
jgi:hypothetical protein